MSGAARLGIAITTYNRRGMVLALVEALRELTSCGFDLVVCDDGSADDTVAALRARGVAVVGGVNRGIAWNKNRGLFYLREIIGAEVILLLDDVLPVRRGWEQDWVAAVGRLGHVNYLPTGGLLISGGNSPDDPGVSGVVWGPCVAFTRRVLSFVGYLDTRFKGYGHEHTDLTMRAIRSGFGGFLVEEAGVRHHRFYSIDGGLRLLPSESYIDQESMARNHGIWAQSQREPIYRDAWRDKAEYEVVRSEMAAVDGIAAGTPALPKVAGGLRNLARGRLATQSSISQWSIGATVEEDAAGAIEGRPSGGRKFHTDGDIDPWWQVDLGAAMMITEIRIFNTVEPEVRDRFVKFRIAIAFDEDSWIEVCRKMDETPVGGVDGSPFIWRPEFSAWGRLVRITLLGRNFLHLDHVEVLGPAPATSSPLPVVGSSSNKKLFSRFASLGDNCEFGVVQGEAGFAGLDLMRAAGTGEGKSGLVLALRERFAAFGDASDLDVVENKWGEWKSLSRRYDFDFHTQRLKNQIERQKLFDDELKRLGFLASKPVRDLETSDKIFVHKSKRPVAADEMYEVYRAMRVYGRPVLLWVSVVDADHAHATVERLAPGFFRGYIWRLAPYDAATDVRLEDWRELCLAAVRAVAAAGDERDAA